MKVDLEEIEFGHSILSDEVHLGIVNKSRTKFLKKVNVTNSFLDCVIKRWEGKKEIITCGSHQWEVSVKKIKS